MIFYFLEQFVVLFFALAASGFVVTQLTRFYKIILLNLLLAFVVLMGGVVLQLLAPGKNNQWLFNTYIVAETAMLLYAASLFFNSLRAKVVSGATFAVFIAVWLVQVYHKGISVFANKAYIVECTGIVLLYLFVLYRHVSVTDKPVYTTPAFWICCGLILFFGCTIPYIGLVHFLQQKNAVLNTQLYLRIIVSLQNVRYLFTGIAFILYRNKHYSPNPNT